ncbi:PREDICTED: uncharacterized protein LOC105365640 [Ceratosolen solmsi marchali]|uniref:Uncharacterized protein LOC105365640 n=1 Tax=Ceratosolen solmsi marchali TaxID=326594 RepID=A0AAJ6YQ46_9HYME|nr:PREDICTED: uncharacterized protein LOC105365640 [Ceratosolen solmsi marchali]
MFLRLFSVILCTLMLFIVANAETNFDILKRNFKTWSDKCVEAMVQRTNRACHNWGTGEAALVNCASAESNFDILKRNFPEWSDRCVEAMVQLTNRACHNWGTGEAALVNCATSYYGTHKPTVCP